MKRSSPLSNSYISNPVKIWFIFLLMFIPIYLAISYEYYLITVRDEMEILSYDLNHHMEGILATLDVENFKALYAQEAANNENCPPAPHTALDAKENGYYPEDNPLFRKHMDWMKNISLLQPDQVIQTYVASKEKNYVIVIGSSQYFTDPGQSLKFCQLYESPTMYGGLSKRVDLHTPYRNKYGEWISTYLPIKDKNGEIVGAISIDARVQKTAKIRLDLLLGASLILLLVILTSLTVLYILTNTVSKPIKYLTSLAANVKDSTTLIDFSGFKIKKGKWRDETDILSEAIQGMLSRLNKQNRELAKSRSSMQELAHSVIRAQENERKYISRELHGEVGQLLVMLKTSLDDIIQELPKDEEEKHPGSADHLSSRERLTQAATQIEKTLGVVRNISHQMRPSLLDVGDVNLALSEYCREFSQQQKIDVFYGGFIVPNPPEEVAVSFYRFLQEALTNVAKHSSATKIWVRAQMLEADWIQMSVEDNGHGEKTVPTARGIGISGLKERFFLLGGIVEARTIPSGFLVVARAPINPS